MLEGIADRGGIGFGQGEHPWSMTSPGGGPQAKPGHAAGNLAGASGQVQAKVMPNVADERADEAKRRGVQQGVLIEEAWALYRSKNA